MTFSVDHATSLPIIATSFGLSAITDLNKWNNTAFSQLCMSKSDAQLRELAQSPQLDMHKHAIALQKLTERQHDQI